MIVDELFIIYTGRYLCALSSREFNICFLLSLFYLFFFFCLLFVSEAGTLTKFAVKQTVKKAKEKRKKRRETN